MITVFGKEWFKKYNKQLCWLANSFIGNWVFKFTKFGHDLEKYGKITEIHPNAITHKQRLLYNFEKRETRQEYTTQFFGRNEYALRLQKVFYPIWITFHTWDMLIANRFKPAWNLGFDTLTVYPDADTETNTVDSGVGVYTGSSLTWAQLLARAGDYASDASNLLSDGILSGAFAMQASSTTNEFFHIGRSIFLFDTSSLTSSANISATVISLYGLGKTDNLGATPNVNIYTSTPASNTAIVGADFSQVGSTAQCDTAITYSGWNVAGYNDFTLNTTGRGNVSKTSISKFGARNANYDVAATAPSWVSNAYSRVLAYSADNGSNKPKLVVTYTTGPTHTLTCEAGSFTLTGIDTGLTASYKIICETSSFVLTGIDTIIAKGYFIICDTGSFILTGTDIGFKRTYRIVCDAGSFALTGVAVGINKAYKIVCDVGNFALTGINISFKRTYRIACDVGAFTLTGTDISIHKIYDIICETGSFILTGISVRLKKPWSSAPKQVSSFSKTEKPVTSFSKVEKPTSSWTKQDKT